MAKGVTRKLLVREEVKVDLKGGGARRGHRRQGDAQGLLVFSNFLGVFFSFLKKHLIVLRKLESVTVIISNIIVSSCSCSSNSNNHF